MVREDRIQMWGLGDVVDSLFDGGLKNHNEIARRMNMMPSVVEATSDQQVLRKDIENYAQWRTRARLEAQTKALAYSPQGRELVEDARAGVGWLIEQTEMLKMQMPRIHRLYERALERAETAMDDPDNLDVFPTQILTGLEKQMRLFRDIINDVKGDEKITQLLKAQTVNVNQGVSEGEWHARLMGAFRHAECPSCGFKSFDDQMAMGAYARYRRAVAEGRDDDPNVIDA